LTGRPPFLGDSPVAVAYQHVSEPPIPPSVLNPAVSPALDAVTLHALAKNRFDRFQSASEFRADVIDAGAGNLPARRMAAPEPTTTTLFGVNPRAAAGSEGALKELSSTDTNRPTRTQTRPPVAWIWAGIVLVAIVIVAVVFWVGHLSPIPLPNAQSVKVPNLTSQSYDASAAKLEELNLVPERVDISSSTIADGNVVRTNPASGTHVAPQDTVSVYVSSGPETATIPDTSGMSQDQAWAALTKLGFKKGSVTQKDSPTQPANTVLSTAPASGSSDPVGSTVNLVVSSGTVNVPDVTNETLGAATTALSALSLDVQTATSATCTGDGTLVSAQSLPPGEQPQGTSITLTVCTGSTTSTGQATAPATPGH
ncbi:MAG: serine/threonine protein kinase, partial [Frondihabitans sp.]|nr:serine/threonine protein kinase [Frondihabitans sp.]